MREILFRGKLKKDGKWAEGNLVVNIRGVCIITPDETPIGVYGQVDPETVGQFTGLIDKNGKKIFEGDVVQCDKWEFSKNPMCGHVGFNNGCFNIRDIKSQNRPAIDTCFNIKVIGNIHDNPELLEVK